MNHLFDALQQAKVDTLLLASLAALLTIAILLWKLVIEPEAIPTLKVAVTEGTKHAILFYFSLEVHKECFRL